VTAASLFIMLFVFMLTGMPIAVALGLSSVLTIMFFGQGSLAAMSLKLLNTSEHYTLLAIPFIILSGAFMTTGGVARRMVLLPMPASGISAAGLAWPRCSRACCLQRYLVPRRRRLSR
jgi:C4-dicarboxylate transporter DctM subunit